MSIRLIQYHCGRLLESMATNPQTRYHVHRIGEIVKNDVNVLARRAVEQSSIWWRRTKKNLNF